jgi:hypothetical protein
MTLQRRMLITLAAGLAAGVTATAAEAKPPALTRIAQVNASQAQAVAFARTPDGVLHLVWQTMADRSFVGLSAAAISPSGKVGAPVSALTGWTAGQPGLLARPDGSLQALFAAISPDKVSSVWSIGSTDGGASWGAPVPDVLGGGPNEALAWASNVTALLSGSGEVISLPQAGNLVLQQGLGSGATSFQLTNAADGSTTDANLALDAANGAVVAGWGSIAGPDLHDYLQSAAPLGALQAVPGQYRNAVIVAGRDKGAGVFAAYTPDGRHVRLLRYGGGSVAVGSVADIQASCLGVATSLDGRVWVIWGDDGGIAVTRSNKAVTRFEPIQRLAAHAAGLGRVSGDGRLGPLDLLVNEIPDASPAVPGEYTSHVLPILNAAVTAKALKTKKGKITGYAVSVTVSDAGDPVAGATVHVAGKTAKTNAQGVAKLTLPAGTASPAGVTVSAPGYQSLSTKTAL